jgi:Abnormal spindle-like microcephaly-assoc'd, ASPM-SPD-2-Hydin
VGAGATCEIDVAFLPTVVGARTGMLTVASASKTLTAPLTGTGIPDLTGSPTSLNFGNVDIGGASTPQLVTFTNTATAAVPVPQILTAGDYAVTTTCGSTIAALSTCTISVTFRPTATGARNGTLTVNSSSAAYSGLSTALTGNGVDFSLGDSPASGSVVAGLNMTINAVVTPIAGFSAPVSLSCTTNALASTCVPASISFTPSAAVTTAVTITTTSKFTVVGFGGLGGNGLLSLIALGSGLLLWMKRRSAGALARFSLGMMFLAATTLLATGCSGEQPAVNAQYTTPGSYTYTLTATDGFLTRTATYTLTVTSK